jgi:phosphatidylglycerol---prolipoprotein diacylglyceryl transferase
MGEIKFPCWDPVLLDLPGPFDLRWYGLMYVVAFLVGHHIISRQARSGFFPLPQQKVGDLIFALIFGVILGGRMGYVLFYPKSDFFEHPLAIFKIWEGGLSFHGGLIGVAIAFILFARRNKVPVLRLGDCCALAVTPGIFCVRMANFINSELWGRVTTDSVPWAMRFPRDPQAEHLLGLAYLPTRDIRTHELAIQYAFERTPASWQKLLAHAGSEHQTQLEQLKDKLNWSEVMSQVPLRHPSQIYEGLAEGVVLGILLWILYRRLHARPAPGVYGAVFLMGYGVFRFLLEYFRQPDAHMGFFFGWMTMGQILCSAMIVAAILIFWYASRHRQQQQQPEREGEAHE